MSARDEQLLEALGRAHAARGGSEDRAGRLFPVVLLGLFVVALLVAMAAGVTVYQRLNDLSSAADEARSPLGVVVNAARATDSTGFVGEADGPEGSALVLTERLDTGSFETRFYLSDGWLVEEYAIAGRDLDPAGATRLAECDDFSFHVADGLLTVSCDGAEAVVALRSEGTAGAGAGDAS